MGRRAPNQLEPDTRAWLKAHPGLVDAHRAAARGLVIAAQEYDALRHDPDAVTKRVYVLGEYRKWLEAMRGTPAAADDGKGGARDGGTIARLRAAGPARVADAAGAESPTG
jgi:hypothetical protein